MGLVLPGKEAPCLPRRNLWTSGYQCINGLEGSLNIDGCIPPLEFLMPWASGVLRIYILTSSQVVLIGLV